MKQNLSRLTRISELRAPFQIQPLPHFCYIDAGIELQAHTTICSRNSLKPEPGNVLSAVVVDVAVCVDIRESSKVF